MTYLRQIPDKILTYSRPKIWFVQADRVQIESSLGLEIMSYAKAVQERNWNNTYIYVYIYIYIYVCMYVCDDTYMRIYIYIYIYVNFAVP